jgi:hypothetical protein
MSNNTQRYEVVAPMPHFTHLLAMDILIPMVHPFNENVPYWGREEDRDNPLNWVDFCPQFPHLFRLLKWWEGLVLDELPKYVKSNKTDVAASVEYKIEDGEIHAKNVLSDNWHVLSYYSDGLQPATEAEYNDYNDYITKLKTK